MKNMKNMKNMKSKEEIQAEKDAVEQHIEQQRRLLYEDIAKIGRSRKIRLLDAGIALFIIVFVILVGYWFL